MLPRRMRLSRRGFTEAGIGAKRATSEHFSLTIRHSDKEVGGFAAVISKKVAKSAVDRHLLKRRILAVLKDISAPGSSIIVYARAGAPKLTFSALSKELLELLARSGASVR